MERAKVTPAAAPSGTAAAKALPFPKVKAASREAPTSAVKIQLITIVSPVKAYALHLSGITKTLSVDGIPICRYNK